MNINSYSDSSNLTSSQSHEYSYNLDNDNENDANLNYNDSFGNNPNIDYSHLFINNNVNIYPSTSLNREIDGINLLASRSSSNYIQNIIKSDEYKRGLYGDSLNDLHSNLLTPQSRRSFPSVGNDCVSSNVVSSLDVSPSYKFCSTPVTKKSFSSQIEANSNSSIRFNPTSLISLPFGYNNNTFTKIKTDDITYPNIYKKTHRVADTKNDRRFKNFPLSIYGYDPEFNDRDYASENHDSSSKSHLFTHLNNRGPTKSAYNLLVHNDYSSNPYKRRYHNLINERRRLLLSNGETADHISLPDRFPKRPKKSKPRNVISEEVDEDQDLNDEFSLLKKKQLIAYSLPSLTSEYNNYIENLESSNKPIEDQMLKEMVDILTYSISFRQKLHNALTNQNLNEETKMLNDSLFNEETLTKINLYVKSALSSINNDLISLNYAKGMLKTDYDNANSDESYQPFIDYTHNVKRLKKLFRHDQYTLINSYLEPDYDEEMEQPKENYILLSSPSMTFYNGLKCLKGLCSTSDYLFKNNVFTECDSCSGCYLWSEDKSNFTAKGFGTIGAWTFDQPIIYDVMNQNVKKIVNSTLSFINDVSKIAIAEVRIPKPEFSEFTEYNCINGYCCNKCCTCRKSTDQSKLYTSSPSHEQFEDQNVNFTIDTKIATVDLLKNVMGSCSCYCKCYPDQVHVLDRVVNSSSNVKEYYNEAISWYDVDSSNISSVTSSKEFLREHIVQERFILRLKLDSIPMNWKLKMPFTCKLDINLNQSFSPDENVDNLSSDQPALNTNEDDFTPSNKVNHTYTPLVECSSFSSSASSCSVPDNSNDFTVSESDLLKFGFTNANNLDQTKKGIKHFKFLEDFTFWDALELLKSEMNSLHNNVKKNPYLTTSNMCFDAMEIDTSHVKSKSLVLNTESFATDSKDSYIEIALYLPYVPSHILPWEFESVEPSEIFEQSLEANEIESNMNTSLGVNLFKEYNLVTVSFKRVVHFMSMWIDSRNRLFASERRMYERYKETWHEYIRTFDNGKVDVFSWGVLPVRAIDLPHKFIPLPAGYKHNDINYPYINNETMSPFHVPGYGIADIYYRKRRFSQLSHSDEPESEIALLGSSRHREAQLGRRKAPDDSAKNKIEEPEHQTRSNKYLMPVFSNLTGPSIRWTYCLMDSPKEPLEWIQDFKSIPIYKVMKCPEMNFYTIDNLVVYDRKNIVSEEELMEDELNYRVSQVWSMSEVKTFVEKYLMYPKNFSKIAQFLENKKCGDCVEFYYRFKYRLRLKHRVQELRSKIRTKFDMTKNLRREASIMNSLENIMDDCNTDLMRQFNKQNKLAFNSVSDYLLRCGSVDSTQKYFVQYTQHTENHSTDDDYQHTLDNIAEGYFLPTKFLSMTTRKNVEYTTSPDSDDDAVESKRGCFLFDKENIKTDEDVIDPSTDLGKSFIVSINFESYVNNSCKTLKKTALSNIDKILCNYEKPSEFPIDELMDNQLLDIEPKTENPADIGLAKQDQKLLVETPTNIIPEHHQGMVTRKKVISHTRYGYESPRFIKNSSRNKTKKKASKWTLEEKSTYREAFRIYGKDWSKLYHAMAPYGKSLDQIKNYYHKNNYKMKTEYFQ